MKANNKEVLLDYKDNLYYQIDSLQKNKPSELLELQSIIDSSYDSLWITDGEGVIISINKASERICGVTPKEVIGRHVDELVNAGYFSESVAKKVINEQKTSTVLCKNKSDKLVLKTGVPIRDQNGKLSRIVVNVRDVAEIIDFRDKLKTELHFNSHNKLSSSNNFEMNKVYELAANVAKTDCTILILGETGVGKEILTRTIHNLSLRNDKPFIKLNCGAIPTSLFESEFFGYERGAFTGANKDGKLGIFELANKGTLFLDEVGELPIETQAKLLHAIENKQISRVGSIETIDVDTRIITATNKSLENMVKQGTFRQDLYYRLNVISINIPPLRERKEDLPNLIENFIHKYNKKYNLTKVLESETIKILKRHNWPGNIRELENLIERLVITTPSEYIHPDDLPNWFQENIEKNSPPFNLKFNNIIPLKDAVEYLEKELIEYALSKCKSKREAARILGVNHSTIIRKQKKYLGS